MEKTNKHLILTFSFSSDYIYPRCAIERSMVSLYRWACFYSDQTLSLLSVNFTFPKPDYAEFVEKQFYRSVKYNQDQNQLTFPLSVLSIKLRGSQPYLKSMLEERANKVASTSLMHHQISDQVRELLHQDLAVYSSQSAVANKLYVSRSTLSRKLKNEGTSFSQLLSSVRRQLAVEYSHLPVKKLIDKLGFSDESAYYKAKKKWH
ncbi:AraC family transcriptional regulator ligand-binding domain-containing protein [Bermanella sp. R86510]|uniref:helix-turn-helix transcriptional regulator n=1 Tax=unclassified Bermanella TaxID=2627862 RepID=UPI0037CA87C8